MARAQIIPVVNPRGIWHGKKIHVTGRLVVLPGSYETEVSIGDLLLVSGEYRDVTAIATDVSLTVGAAFTNLANDTAPKIIRGTPRTITGAIDVTASTAVVGVGTLFLTELKVGDYLMIGTATAGEARKITAISTALALTVESAFTDLANDTSPQTFREVDLDQIRGSIDPAASATVTGVNTKFLGQGLRFNLATDGPRVLNFGARPVSLRAWGRGLPTYTYQNREFYQRLQGSIDTTASTTVAGVSTRFLSELGVGDRIIVGTEERTVRSIASDISLVVTRAHTDQANDTFPKKIIQSPTLADGQLRVWGTTTAGVEMTTAAVPNIVVDDVIEFHAIMQPGL